MSEVAEFAVKMLALGAAFLVIGLAYLRLTQWTMTTRTYATDPGLREYIKGARRADRVMAVLGAVLLVGAAVVLLSGLLTDAW